jgi:hypothetical protein
MLGQVSLWLTLVVGMIGGILGQLLLRFLEVWLGNDQK